MVDIWRGCGWVGWPAHPIMLSRCKAAAFDSDRFERCPMSMLHGPGRQGRQVGKEDPKHHVSVYPASLDAAPLLTTGSDVNEQAGL